MLEEYKQSILDSYKSFPILKKTFSELFSFKLEVDGYCDIDNFSFLSSDGIKKMIPSFKNYPKSQEEMLGFLQEMENVNYESISLAITSVFLKHKKDDKSLFKKDDWPEVVYIILGLSNDEFTINDRIILRKTINKHCIKSVSELINSVIKIDGNSQYIYRGHSNINYLLCPGLFRKNLHNTGFDFGELEEKLEDSFRRRMYFCLNNKVSDKFEEKCLFQHYSLPTRMLDFTLNPLIALYFACDDETVDGEIVIIDKPKEFDLFSDKKKLKFLNPYYTNERIKNQMGLFAYFDENSSLGIKKLMEEINSKKSSRLFVVESKNKKSIRKQLACLGIDEGFIYPELEHIAKAICDEIYWEDRI